MSNLSVQLTNAPGQVSLRDSIMRKIAEDQVSSVELQGVLALPAAPGVRVAELTLPELPAGAKWLLGAATDVQAKLATTGTAGTTQIRLTDGADVADLDVVNTDGDDTFVNGASISATSIDGGTVLFALVEILTLTSPSRKCDSVAL